MITGIAVNDAPVAAVPATQSVNENGTLTFSTINGNAITVSDVDGGNSTQLLTLSVNNGTLTLNGTTGLTLVSGNNGTGIMQYSGTLANFNAALDGMVFTPTLNFSGPVNLNVIIDDQGNIGTGGALSDSQSLPITVNFVNQPPSASNLS